MSNTPVPFAPETLESIQRAFRLATDHRHDTVGLEHLLLAITDEPQSRKPASVGSPVISESGELERALHPYQVAS